MPKDRNRIAIRAPGRLIEAAELVASRKGVTLSEVVRQGLRDKVRYELGLEADRSDRDREPVGAA